MLVLWLDDDSPSTVPSIGSAIIVPVRTCGTAEAWLERQTDLPNWIVVDLCVPQGGWRSSRGLFPRAGKEYASHIKQKYGDKIRVAIFTMALGKEQARVLLDAGANSVFSKAEISFTDLIRELEAYVAQETRIEPVDGIGASVPAQGPRRPLAPDNETTAFMAVVAHELKHIFYEINIISRSILKKPERRRIMQLMKASEAGSKVLRRIEILSRVGISSPHPLRTHRARAVSDLLRRMTSATRREIELPDNRLVEADLYVLQGAIEDMVSVGNEASKHGVHLVARMTDNDTLLIRVQWNHEEESLFGSGSEAGTIQRRYLSAVAELHKGIFIIEESCLTLTLPLK